MARLCGCGGRLVRRRLAQLALFHSPATRTLYVCTSCRKVTQR